MNKGIPGMPSGEMRTFVAIGERSTHANLEFLFTDGNLVVAGPTHRHSVASLTNVHGKLVRQYSGMGSAMGDTKWLSAGVYAVASPISQATSFVRFRFPAEVFCPGRVQK